MEKPQWLYTYLILLCSGVSSIQETASAQRVAGVTFAYIFSTNLLGCVIGLLVAIAMKPGDKLGQTLTADKQYNSYTDIFGDLLRLVKSDRDWAM